MDEQAFELFCNFYPRPPRGGRPKKEVCEWTSTRFLSTPSARRATVFRGSSCILFSFLSTPSARRATSPLKSPMPELTNFYPRPPRGGRQSKFPGVFQGFHISIHALREEGDVAALKEAMRHQAFLSTPSARRATLLEENGAADVPISIHALREEGDRKCRFAIPAIRSFLSTPSARRATGDIPWAVKMEIKFLSTPSARRATAGAVRG